jgi:cobaltochelatase CobS
MAEPLNAAHELVSRLRASKAAPTGPGVEKVDPHLWEDPMPLKLLEYAVARRKNAYVYGPTGCGKSSLVINVLARKGEAMEYFSCAGETSTDELIGKPWRKPSGEVVVVYGAAVRAYRDGKVLLLEEVDHAQPDILTPLHRMLEVNRDFMTINIGDGEVIPRNPRFSVIATANTIGTGEGSWQYNGTKPMNAAFMSRFGVVPMGYAPEAEEKKILVKKTGIKPDMAQTLVRVAHEARELLVDATNRIATAISTRDLLEWAELIITGNFTMVQAATWAFLGKANEADREVLTRLVENACS